MNTAAPIARAGPINLFVSTTGSGTGCTQPAPCDLATALSQSTPGDTIYVAQGNYTGAGTAVVTLTKSITLFGGWDASLATPPVHDPETYPTTLDGENARRVVSITGNITPTLDGFILTRGNASSAALGLGRGGGIYSDAANPIITHNVITANVAHSNTTAWAFGGGIYIVGTPIQAVVSDNLIANNIANATSKGMGGGLEIRDSNRAIISRNTFQANVAGTTTNGEGGALYLYNTPAFVSGNLVRDNYAASTGDGFGGGFYSQYGQVDFSENVVTGNTAQYGAVTFEYSSNLMLANNIIANNPAGGVFVRGGASDPLAGLLVINTIAQNGEVGVYAGWFSSGYTTLTLTNNIIVSQTTGIYAYPDLHPNVVTATHTLFYVNGQDTNGLTIASTAAITGSDHRFAASAGLDYHLWAGSPAIDAGLNLPWLTIDVDGESRPWPVGGGYDIGADEAYWRPVYLPHVSKNSG